MGKTFKDTMRAKASNPTMQFISAPEENPQPEINEPVAAPPARRAIPQYEETKSRRLQLLLTPSLYEAIKERASEERMSVNELINSVLRDALRK